MSSRRHLFMAWIAALGVITSSSLPVSAAERRIYVFGNSLIHHVSDSAQTNVPYWLQYISSKSGDKFTLDGQWGFLKDFHSKLPPRAQWSFKGVRRAWTESQSFERVGFDTIIVNSENFIQYRQPTETYEGDNPDGVSPLTSTQRLFGWVGPRTKDAQFFIYEGWADMGTVAKEFPPSAATLAGYHKSNLASYHDWHETLLEAINTSADFGRVKLIPASSVIATLMTKTDLETLSATDLYLDDAPHGTANTYFLAALVTYAALFDSRPPTDLSLPNSIHEKIRENLAVIADTICANQHITCKK